MSYSAIPLHALPGVASVSVSGIWVLYPTADTVLDAASSNLNTSAQTVLRLPSTGDRVALLKFDTSLFSATNLTADALVSANLILNVLSRNHSYAATVGVYKMVRAWEPEEATWQKASVYQWWSTGGAGSSSDRNQTAETTFVLNITSGEVTVDLTNLFAYWLNDPSSNLGIALIASGNNAVEYTLASKEYATNSMRPRLEVR